MTRAGCFVVKFVDNFWHRCAVPFDSFPSYTRVHCEATTVADEKRLNIEHLYFRRSYHSNEKKKRTGFIPARKTGARRKSRGPQTPYLVFFLLNKQTEEEFSGKKVQRVGESSLSVSSFSSRLCNKRNLKNKECEQKARDKIENERKLNLNTT